MPETSRVMLLRRFCSPLVPADLPVPELAEGGMLVRVLAAGVCGSDLELVEQRDPRLQDGLLPLIPGHEGVGVIQRLAGQRHDLTGATMQEGDHIIWNRGITCGKCYDCAVRRRPALCVSRRVYGINLPAAAPTWLNGCYSELLYVRPESEAILLPRDADPAALVSAACSGATAAHAAELSGIEVGDTVLVVGPGPLGLWCAAFARARGAARVLVAGSERSRARLALAEEMGCEPLLPHALAAWRGPRLDVVMDAAGTAASVRDAIRLVGRGGTVALPGVATPIGETPVDLYHEVSAKGVRLQGVWVSDARHLHQAVSLALRPDSLLGKLVTHRFRMAEANEALAAVKSRDAIKAVLVPD